MLLGTVLFAQVFGWFVEPGGPAISAGAPFLLAAAMLAATLVFFLTLREVKTATRR